MVCDMKQSSLLCGMLLAAALLLAGCSQSETGLTGTGMTETDVTATPVSVSGAKGTIQIDLPEDWSWETYIPEHDTPEMEAYGMRIYPDAVSEGYIELVYIESFGVCGTGLEETEITLAGDTAFVGTYDNGKTWNFISFQGKNQGIVALERFAHGWLDDYEEQALSILNTLKFEPQQ